MAVVESFNVSHEWVPTSMTAYLAGAWCCSSYQDRCPIAAAAVQESFAEAVYIKITALMANVALIAPLGGSVIVAYFSWQMMFVLFAVLAAVAW